MGTSRVLRRGAVNEIGSSPRVWGQAENAHFALRQHRIIPTRMGTSCAVVFYIFVDWDHPHAYGDKFIRCSQIVIVDKSSPRVWGQVFETKLNTAGARIIPTRMGTRYTENQRLNPHEDHPHAYGDKFNRINRKRIAIGSSPRVWGQASKRCLRHSDRGIIPTRMGTSNRSRH